MSKGNIGDGVRALFGLMGKTQDNQAKREALSMQLSAQLQLHVARIMNGCTGVEESDMRRNMHETLDQLLDNVCEMGGIKKQVDEHNPADFRPPSA